MESGRIRKKKRAFTQVSNAAMRDPNLSLKAKGLYALINSYIDIPDFELYKGFLMKQCMEGKAAFQSSWDELKKAGYLIQHQVRNGNRFTYEYELLDTPNDNSQHTDFQDTENEDAHFEDTQNQGDINNTESTNTDQKNTYNSSSKESEEFIHNNFDDDEINKITQVLFQKREGKALTSLPAKYSCDKQLLLVAIKLALENHAANEIGYIVQIFKDWKASYISHLSDLGIDHLCTEEETNRLLAMYREELDNAEGDVRPKDMSEELTALSKVCEYRYVLGLLRKGLVNFNDVNYEIKYLLNR